LQESGMGEPQRAKATPISPFSRRGPLLTIKPQQGIKGVYLLRSVEGEQAHFLTLTFWESREAIERFAGTPIEKAKYYPEDQDFLLELEPTVTHYEVFASRVV
jgi:heme-degrading monooxygenase HmoA